MKLKNLFAEEQAVSPIIGVILMVAITVILAAVIATFVLGLGEQVSSSAPQASFSFEYDADATSLQIYHDGGDTILAENLYVRGGVSSTGDWSSDGVGTYDDDHKVGAGDSITISANKSDELRVVYQSGQGKTSATLAKWEGPNA